MSLFQSPFLVERLRLQSFPVIALISGEKIGDYIRLADKLKDGVEALEILIERRAYEAGVLDKCRPEKKPKAAPTIFGAKPARRGIRGGDTDESDDDY